MKYQFINVLVLCLLFSCTSESKKEGYYGNISELIPWINQDLVKEVNLPNHTYVAYVDSSREFSYGFRAYYKDISPSNPRKVEVSCNIYPYNLPNKVQLVFEMKENDTNILWISEKISNGEVGKWNKVSLKTPIPQNLPPNVLIQVYLWSPEKETALADNFYIKFE